ncbi:MAG: hypothetical protein HOV80_16400, partial [Polyangiaceae bacterium]|nr:hypothetical protein [Polyangiaceae bacterium]
LAALALAAAGLPSTDQRIERAMGFVLASVERDADGATVPGNHSSVWSTALSLRALLHAGDRLESGLLESLLWLLGAQATEPNALCNHRSRGAVRTGGFAFQHANDKMTDSDDTAVVIDTLAACLGRPELPGDLRPEVEAAIERALLFLEGMQNPDGGWSAFVHGLPGKPTGPIMTTPLSAPTSLSGLMKLVRTPLYAFGDPSTEDVTGRVLRALGNRRVARRPAAIARGRAFLERQQCKSGAWWGRWSTNFLWGTPHALVGLVATGSSLDAPAVRRGIDYLRSRQRRDGSFGETERSFGDPSLDGRGPSMPPLTATVLEALVKIGLTKSEMAQRAAENLMRTQLADGDWPDGGHLQVMIPPLSFYAYPGSHRHPPLEALALYRAAGSRLHRGPTFP